MEYRGINYSSHKNLNLINDSNIYLDRINTLEQYEFWRPLLSNDNQKGLEFKLTESCEWCNSGCGSCGGCGAGGGGCSGCNSCGGCE